MGEQISFGGPWTEKKLQTLSKYLLEYRKIFAKNPRAQFFRISYVDAFAGTGRIPRGERNAMMSFWPELELSEDEFRKGSARRALEIDPPFHHYLFIEKHQAKFNELSELTAAFPGREIELINSDAKAALLDWCARIDRVRERAVVFLDPFGASVEWNVIVALAETKAVDLWFLFPCATINRLLPKTRKPRPSWADKLTRVLGTADWEDEFYSNTSNYSILDPDRIVRRLVKTADQRRITNFFVNRLRSQFTAVADPGFLCNSKGPLFALIFAAGNEKGAGPGLRIAEHLLKNLNT
jgi:three-Cys-motif partner protein